MLYYVRCKGETSLQHLEVLPRPEPIAIVSAWRLLRLARRVSDNSLLPFVSRCLVAPWGTSRKKTTGDTTWSCSSKDVPAELEVPAPDDTSGQKHCSRARVRRRRIARRRSADCGRKTRGFGPRAPEHARGPYRKKG